MSKYYLGVDAGGTSTKATIIDESGREVASAHSGPGNYRSVGLDQAITSMVLAISSAINQTKIKPEDIQAICIGAASIDTKLDYETVYSPLKTELTAMRLNCPLKLVNDAVIAMRAATTNPNAILIIMGTGANCYGTNSHGQEVWVSGLDYLLSDEAGGYMLGLNVLRAAVRSSDGRDSKTILEELVRKELQISNLRDLKNIVYAPGYSKKEIAHFSKLALQAYQQNDLTATRLVHEIVEEAKSMVAAAHKRLSLNGNSFDLIMVGGLTHDKIIQSLLSAQIHKDYPNSKLIFPTQKSSRGAALLARDIHESMK
ncbi:MAG: kinase [Patescibacteria group bacterium]|nr:MAG: kinase [Patescibacteria group bacterium]